MLEVGNGGMSLTEVNTVVIQTYLSSTLPTLVYGVLLNLLS